MTNIDVNDNYIDIGLRGIVIVDNNKSNNRISPFKKHVTVIESPPDSPVNSNISLLNLT